MSDREDTRGSRLLRFSGFFATGLSPLLGAAASVSEGLGRWGWAVTAAMAAFYAAYCGHQVQRRLRMAQAAAKNAVDRLDAALVKIAPLLVEALQEVCLATDVHTRKTKLGRLQEIVVESARSLGGKGARVALYRFDNHRPHKAGECLERETHRGRNDKPRERFCRVVGNEDEEVITVAKGDRGRLYRDIVAEPPRGIRNPEERIYRSIMFTPVRADKTSFGMLSVDHPVAGSFDDRHVSLLNILASSLATGIAIDIAADRAAAPTGSEPKDLAKKPPVNSTTAD